MGQKMVAGVGAAGHRCIGLTSLLLHLQVRTHEGVVRDATGMGQWGRCVAVAGWCEILGLQRQSQGWLPCPKDYAFLRRLQRGVDWSLGSVVPCHVDRLAKTAKTTRLLGTGTARPIC